LSKELGHSKVISNEYYKIKNNPDQEELESISDFVSHKTNALK